MEFEKVVLQHPNYSGEHNCGINSDMPCVLSDETIKELKSFTARKDAKRFTEIVSSQQGQLIFSAYVSKPLPNADDVVRAFIKNNENKVFNESGTFVFAEDLFFLDASAGIFISLEAKGAKAALMHTISESVGVGGRFARQCDVMFWNLALHEFLFDSSHYDADENFLDFYERELPRLVQVMETTGDYAEAPVQYSWLEERILNGLPIRLLQYTPKPLWLFRQLTREKMLNIMVESKVGFLSSQPRPRRESRFYLNYRREAWVLSNCDYFEPDLTRLSWEDDPDANAKMLDEKVKLSGSLGQKFDLGVLTLQLMSNPDAMRSPFLKNALYNFSRFSDELEDWEKLALLAASYQGNMVFNTVEHLETGYLFDVIFRKSDDVALPILKSLAEYVIDPCFSPLNTDVWAEFLRKTDKELKEVVWSLPHSLIYPLLGLAQEQTHREPAHLRTRSTIRKLAEL